MLVSVATLELHPSIAVLICCVQVGKNFTQRPPVLRRLHNPVVIFGIVIVLLCWIGACLQGLAERAEAGRVAIERGDTAARLFEKDTVSLLKGIDTIMLLVRQAYEADPDTSI